MTEENNNPSYAPDKVSVITCEGANYLNVEHNKFDTRGGMVYLVGLERDDEEMRSVMIPTENIRHVKEIHRALSEEELAEMQQQAEEVQAQETEVQAEGEAAVEAEIAAEHRSPPDDDKPHLVDLTVEEIDEALDDYTYHEDYLKWCMQEDDRVTAVEEYETHLAERSD